MALVTVQRSPSSSNSLDALSANDDAADGNDDDADDNDKLKELNDTGTRLAKAGPQRRFSESYFAVKGAAIILPPNDYLLRAVTNRGDLQHHLQSMANLLRPEDTLKMAVELECQAKERRRYLVLVACNGKQDTEECCILGVDYTVSTGNFTIGNVIPVLANTKIVLDGDGGFVLHVSTDRTHMLKPVSVQAMWSALQALNRACDLAQLHNYFPSGLTHTWTTYYDARIDSDRPAIQEWYAMDEVISRRVISPDKLGEKMSDKDEVEAMIRVKLKEIMMTVDLEEVTSKYLRTELEKSMKMNLSDYKSYIDEEMIVILRQMEAPTEIFDYLYLGSEWNASNYEELKANDISHILNVTKEIDNFFNIGLGFEYKNIRVYDEEETELLHHFNEAHSFITEAKEKGAKVLVHCKMGVSRSASCVIAHIMKTRGWSLEKAINHVKSKRSCIKPNPAFMRQLEEYQGILDASKHRNNSLWRSKSDMDLATPDKSSVSRERSESTNIAPSEKDFLSVISPATFEDVSRPKSWSPSDSMTKYLEEQLSIEYVASLNEEPPMIPVPSGRDRSCSTSWMDSSSFSFSAPPAESEVPFQFVPGVSTRLGSSPPGPVLVRSPSSGTPPTPKLIISGVTERESCTDTLEEEEFQAVGKKELSELADIPRVASVRDIVQEFETQRFQEAEQKLSKSLDLGRVKRFIDFPHPHEVGTCPDKADRDQLMADQLDTCSLDTNLVSEQLSNWLPDQDMQEYMPKPQQALKCFPEPDETWITKEDELSEPVNDVLEDRIEETDRNSSEIFTESCVLIDSESLSIGEDVLDNQVQINNDNALKHLEEKNIQKECLDSPTKTKNEQRLETSKEKSVVKKFVESVTKSPPNLDTTESLDIGPPFRRKVSRTSPQQLKLEPPAKDNNQSNHDKLLASENIQTCELAVTEKCVPSSPEQVISQEPAIENTTIQPPLQNQENTFASSANTTPSVVSQVAASFPSVANRLPDHVKHDQIPWSPGIVKRQKMDYEEKAKLESEELSEKSNLCLKRANSFEDAPVTHVTNVSATVRRTQSLKIGWCIKPSLKASNTAIEISEEVEEGKEEMPCFTMGGEDLTTAFGRVKQHALDYETKAKNSSTVKAKNGATLLSSKGPESAGMLLLPEIESKNVKCESCDSGAFSSQHVSAQLNDPSLVVNDAHLLVSPSKLTQSGGSQEGPSGQKDSVTISMGTVRQQKEVLESLNKELQLPRASQSENRMDKDMLRLIREVGRSLVGNTAGAESEEKENIAGIGHVRKIAREIEKRAGVNHKRMVIFDKFGNEISTPRKLPLPDDSTTKGPSTSQCYSCEPPPDALSVSKQASKSSCISVDIKSDISDKIDTQSSVDNVQKVVLSSSPSKDQKSEKQTNGTINTNNNNDLVQEAELVGACGKKDSVMHREPKIVRGPTAKVRKTYPFDAKFKTNIVSQFCARFDAKPLQRRKTIGSSCMRSSEVGNSNGKSSPATGNDQCLTARVTKLQGKTHPLTKLKRCGFYNTM